MILFLNACVREASRTKTLALAVLEQLDGEVTEVRLSELPLCPLSEERLAERSALIEKGEFSAPLFDPARQFAKADEIVIAAPFWDLSFPSLLKLYVENIYVTGIVSEYDENGLPHGLCRARRLIYVTTAGGPYEPAYSYGYLERLAKGFFGIPDTRLVAAEGLDLIGHDPEKILSEAIRTLRENGLPQPT